MHVEQLFARLRGSEVGREPLKKIKKITSDSRAVDSDTVFVAIKGTKADGHTFIPDVIKKGAAGIVAQTYPKPKDFQGAWASVEDTRFALAQLADLFYGEPSKQLFAVGVTGTNGKTTTTHIVEHILGSFGWPTGVIGTINHHLENHIWETELTTPDALSLQERFSQMLEMNAKAVAFEVSSIAIHQHRADFVAFDAMIFTNFTRDHLDYHGTMDEYFAAKEKLFLDLPLLNPKPKTVAVMNADDPASKKFKIAHGVKVWTYGETQSDFQFTLKGQTFQGTEFHLKTPVGEDDFLIPLPGVYNVSNSVAAIAVAVHAGMTLPKIKESLRHFHGVPGRMQRVTTSSQKNVFVDYAHTPDALETVLKMLNMVRKSQKDTSKIVTLFGCGGDRDPGKRPMMAEIAEKYSDIIVVTSDNPRTENPQKIVDDVAAGLKNTGAKVEVELDRRRAIEKAVRLAGAGDVVLIAGKGHENYQIVGKEKLPFNDYEIAQEFLG